MSTIRFGGLASGLDVESLITGLMSAERIPLNALKSRQSAVDKAKETVSDFSKKLAALKAAADSLADPNKFASLTATSSDTTILAASASGAASPGTYRVIVNALAKEERTYSDAKTSSTNALNTSGTLRITVGTGSPVDVSVASTDSLTSIATKINSSGARVGATVLYDGTNYRLLVRGLDTGAANTITFNENGGLSLGLNKSSNQLQAATDASIRIDGFTITRPTNQITDVIPGVTIALAKTSSSGADVKIQSDPDGLQKKIETFVTAYNDVVKAGHAAAGFGSQKASSAELRGDGSIRSALSQLAQVMYTPVTGTSGSYTTLASVGLALKSDGAIALDGTKLSSALTADPTAVAKLFTVNPSLGADGAMGTFRTLADTLTSTSNSLIQSRIDGLAALSKRLGTDAEKLGARLTDYESRLRAQFTALDQRVSAYNAQLAAVSATGGTSYTG